MDEQEEGGMTRIEEIQSRLSKATPGPWVFDGTEIDTVPDYKSENPAPWKSIMECRVDCMSYCYGGSVAMDIGSDDRALIEHAPADVAYLLAELRKAQDKVADVLAIADIGMNSKHGDPKFIQGWECAIEEIKARAAEMRQG